MQDIRELIRVKESVEEELFRIPGVIGVGVGLKTVGGELTDELAIWVNVAKKRADVPPAERIPPEIHGCKTDVVEYRIVPCNAPDFGEYDPLEGGIVINVEGVGLCTLGAIVKFPNGELALLTSVHGLQGARVLQSFDLSPMWATQSIGTVMPNFCFRDSEVDVCLIRPEKLVDINCDIVEIGKITGTVNNTDLLEFMQVGGGGQYDKTVAKRGFMTDLTEGRIIGINTTYDIGTPPEIPVLRMNNLIQVRNNSKGEPMAAQGDSGSIGVAWHKSSGRFHAFGLLIATAGADALFIPIEPVLNRLGVVFCSATQTRWPRIKHKTPTVPDLVAGIILGGVTQGGGGFYITPGGIIKRIPPHGPATEGKSLSKHVEQILSLLSVSEIAQTIDDPAVRDRIVRTALEAVITRARGMMPEE